MLGASMGDIMPRKAGPNTEAVSIRLPKTYLARASNIAEAVSLVSFPGISITRAEVLRVALEKGLDLLHKEINERMRRDLLESLNENMPAEMRVV
jgi:hypothetical protein